MSFFSVRCCSTTDAFITSRIVIDAMFIYESLHVSVVKLLPHIGLHVFRLSTALSNYLGNSVSVSLIFYSWAVRLISTHTCSARQWQWECNGNLCWNENMDASQWYQPATGHRISNDRTMTCLFGKFFLAGACNSSTSRRFSALTTFPSDLMFRAQLSIGWRIITRAMKLHYELFHF